MLSGVALPLPELLSPMLIALSRGLGGGASFFPGRLDGSGGGPFPVLPTALPPFIWGAGGGGGGFRAGGGGVYASM